MSPNTILSILFVPLEDSWLGLILINHTRRFTKWFLFKCAPSNGSNIVETCEIIYHLHCSENLYPIDKQALSHSFAHVNFRKRILAFCFRLRGIYFYEIFHSFLRFLSSMLTKKLSIILSGAWVLWNPFLLHASIMWKVPYRISNL